MFIKFLRQYHQHIELIFTLIIKSDMHRLLVYVVLLFIACRLIYANEVNANNDVNKDCFIVRPKRDESWLK